MKRPNTSRRRLLLGVLSGLGSLVFAGRSNAAVATPKTTAGPYYPEPNMRTPDIDNDLVKIVGKVKRAGGEIVTLRGTIFDKNGTPRAGHRVEIWQCDVDGNYMHTLDPRSVDFDPAFQGFGHDITDENGQYVFRTIKPTIYPGRTPHIHMKVFDGTREILTTQFYIKGHPNNARDGLFNRMSNKQAQAVSMEFKRRNGGVEADMDVYV